MFADMSGAVAVTSLPPGHERETLAARPIDRAAFTDAAVGPVGELMVAFVRYAGCRRLAAATALIMAGTFLEGVGILLLVQLLQVLLEPRALAGSEHLLGPASQWFFAGIPGALRVTLGLGAFAVLIIARGAVLAARDILVARLQHGFVETIKLRFLECIASASWTSVAKVEQAKLVQMLGSEIVQMSIAVRGGLRAGVGAVMLLGLAAFAVVLAPGIVLFTLAFVAAIGAAVSHFAHRARRLGRTLLHHDLTMAGISSHFLSSLKLAKAQGVQESFLERHAVASRASLSRRIAFARALSISRNVVTIVGALAVGAAIISGARLFEVAPSVLIALVLVLSRMTSPALVLLEGLQQVAHNIPRFELLRSLADELTPPSSAAAGAEEKLLAATRRCPILLDRVSFQRSVEDDAGLSDLCLAIGDGELVGISGASGSGKTTLLDIVAGLIEPDSGTFEIDERAVTGAFAYQSARLSYVGQEPTLFAGSLGDNLRWSAPDVTDDEIWRALDLVGATRLARRDGRGLDTMLADAANNLSAGERQRLALAAALLRRPTLLLLDEATSSLDAASEKAVIESIRRLDPRPTILMVSHRAESLALCGRVVTLAGGRIVAEKTEAGLQFDHSLNPNRRSP